MKGYQIRTCNLMQLTKQMAMLFVLGLSLSTSANEPFQVKYVYIQESNAGEYGIIVHTQIKRGVAFLEVDLTKHKLCAYKELYVRFEVTKGVPEIPSYTKQGEKLFIAVNELYLQSLFLDFSCNTKSLEDVAKYFILFDKYVLPVKNSKKNSILNRIKNFFIG